MSDANGTQAWSELPLTIIFDVSGKRENATVDDKYHFYGYPLVVPLSLLMLCFIVLAVVGNVLVIVTIVRHRGMRTRTNMFIVNLAAADILVAVLDMPVSLTTVVEGRWVFGEALCQLNGFTMALFLICSIHTLMYIAVHKYISITMPFSRFMTPRRIKLMIGASWLWATICATGPLIGWNHIEYKKGASQCGPGIPNGGRALSHSLVITASNYLLPLAVMTFCYWRIFREIHVHMNRIRETSNIDLQNSVAQQKKVATTLFLVLACFVVCWTPFVIYSTAAALIKDKRKVKLVFNPLAYWCGYMNSACNPIIYAFRSPSFRKGYKEIMCGTSETGLAAANSLSFRSRSGRGSLKSNSNAYVVPAKQEEKKQRRMLSQTSWMSLPMIPYFRRTVSQANRAPTEADLDSSTVECTMCGLCKEDRPISTVSQRYSRPRPPIASNPADAQIACHEDTALDPATASNPADVQIACNPGTDSDPDLAADAHLMTDIPLDVVDEEKAEETV